MIAVHIIAIMLYVAWMGATLYKAGKGISPRWWEVALLLAGALFSSLVDIVGLLAGGAA